MRLIDNNSRTSTEYLNSLTNNSNFSYLRPYAVAMAASNDIRDGNNSQAAEAYAKLIKEYPAHPMLAEWLYSEGMLYKYEMNNPEKAAELFNQVIELFPDNPTAQSAKRELNTMPSQKKLVKSTEAVEFSLGNYPNPFNPSTIISYELPKAGIVNIKVYDLLGREVATLVNEFKSEGKYTVEFNGSKLPSGVYVYRLQANGYTAVKKMQLIK